MIVYILSLILRGMGLVVSCIYFFLTRFGSTRSEKLEADICCTCNCTGRNAFLSFAPHFHPNKNQVNEYLKTHPGATEEEWCDEVEWTRIDGKRNDGRFLSTFSFAHEYREADVFIIDQGGATQSKEVKDVSEKVFLLALGYHFASKFEPNNAEGVG